MRNLNQGGIKINLLHQLIRLKQKFSAYFSEKFVFWRHDLNVLRAEQTNIDSVQKTGSSLNKTEEEIEHLIGIQKYMSNIRFPNLYMYWANEQGILLLQTSCVETDINN